MRAVPCPRPYSCHAFSGEANTESEASAAAYSCLFPAVIEAWRNLFNAPDAYFGFIQLSTWCLACLFLPPPSFYLALQGRAAAASSLGVTAFGSREAAESRLGIRGRCAGICA